MIPETQWCQEVAGLLGLADPRELVEVLAIAEYDRDRARRFSLTMRKIGLCPVEVARATVRAGGWPAERKEGAAAS